jgi:hypothetical protein
MALSERDRERLSLFVDEMRAMREQRGWSRAELATHAQYSESLIAMVEDYDRGVTQSLGKALDRAFGTPGFTEDAPGQPGTPGTFGRMWLKLMDDVLGGRVAEEAPATAVTTAPIAWRLASPPAGASWCATPPNATAPS